MRYLYAIALVLFTGYYTFPHDINSEYIMAPVAGDDDDDNNKGNSNKEDYFEVEVQTGLNFVVDQPEDFERTDVKVNAVKLNVRSKKDPCTIYARISSYNTPNGADRSNIPIELQHRSDNSSKAYNLVTTPVQLTTTDQRLFNQTKNNKELNYYYDVRLMPLGYDYPEGQYNFSILYTMTKQ
jgi:hypothetical protein